MNKIYDKPYKSAKQLVDFLLDYKLNISNHESAESFLSKINYHRFKIYLKPLWDKNNNCYNSDYTFEDAIELYRFDDELRDLLFTIIGRIEIKLRTRLDHTISNYTNDPFWYLNDKWFNKNSAYRFRSKLNSNFLQSQDSDSLHFKNNYINDKNANYKNLPPFWAIIELSTFGTMMDIFKALNKDEFKFSGKENALDTLSKEFGANNLKVLNSWIVSIRDIRNKCAHHARLWNSNLREPSSIKKLLSKPPAHPNRIYLFFIVVEILCNNLDIDINIKEELTKLFGKYPAVNYFKDSMGVPDNWSDDIFWERGAVK
ncbi:Abi family protein [Thiospirochaeta perfilievii]|uniref:Abi family protein n=1 Tax=Thiospirochaeta perfilievii TaxID=252967 RepID=A0A5C1Q993_9SPIO|nr:Abi family protein [Thiospirochaeta perfilievii]QEN04081.1 Abi family protein [Thiospirochaeta perfilievii]